MRWNLKYAIRSYVSGSIWLIPLFALLFYALFKFYASSGVSARTGNNYDLVGVAWQYRWGGGW